MCVFASVINDYLMREIPGRKMSIDLLFLFPQILVLCITGKLSLIMFCFVYIPTYYDYLSCRYAFSIIFKI